MNRSFKIKKQKWQWPFMLANGCQEILAARAYSAVACNGYGSGGILLYFFL
jgi:hypothetical protein